MKFSKYLNENKDFSLSEVIDILKRDCDYYLKIWLSQNRPINNIWHGTDRNVQSLKIKKIRKDRKPRDMNKLTHEYLDEIFNELIGIKVRSKSIFVSSDKEQAAVYGFPRLVFPIGNFDIVWSRKVVDLYIELVDDGLVYSELEDLKKFIKEKNYIKGKIKEFLDSFREGMLVYSNVYLLNEEFLKKNGLKRGYEDLFEILKKG